MLAVGAGPQHDQGGEQGQHGDDRDDLHHAGQPAEPGEPAGHRGTAGGGRGTEQLARALHAAASGHPAAPRLDGVVGGGGHGLVVQRLRLVGPVEQGGGVLLLRTLLVPEPGHGCTAGVVGSASPGTGTMFWM